MMFECPLKRTKNRPNMVFFVADYTTNIDVWSVGCVFAELILGQPNFCYARKKCSPDAVLDPQRCCHKTSPLVDQRCCSKSPGSTPLRRWGPDLVMRARPTVVVPEIQRLHFRFRLVVRGHALARLRR